MLAEESLGSHGDSAALIVDPLDGTINFLYGFPALAVSIAPRTARAGMALVHSPFHQRPSRRARGGSTSR